jgi:hypothetical protein
MHRTNFPSKAVLYQGGMLSILVNRLNADAPAYYRVQPKVGQQQRGIILKVLQGKLEGSSFAVRSKCVSEMKVYSTFRIVEIFACTQTPNIGICSSLLNVIPVRVQAMQDIRDGEYRSH